MLSAITAFFELLKQYFSTKQTALDKAATNDALKDKKSLKKASNITEKIINLVDKYKSTFTEKDLKLYEKYKKQFEKVN